MIDISLLSTHGWQEAILGARNSWNSRNKSDTKDDILGKNDLELMKKLAHFGPTHAKYRRMINVYIDILAPLYWWKEFDTYKIGTVTNSSSTMHTITKKIFDITDFSCEKISGEGAIFFQNLVDQLNRLRELYFETEDGDKKKELWYQIIQLLPESYNQQRTVMLNYEVLTNIYKDRKNHKLQEWRDFRSFIESLPYAGLLIFDGDNDS